MRLGIGLGLFKAGLISAGVRIFSAFQTRVIGDGGTVESGTCVVNGINGSALLQQASLLLIPSGYKGGKLYAEIPTNGNGDLTWARTGTANRTNASGNIELMATGVPRLSYMYGSCPAVLAEPQRTNLALQSQDFDNASWSKVASSITSNSTTAPDGNTTADTITDNSTPSVHTADQNVSSAGTYTFSVYAKKGTLNFVGLYSTQSGQGAFFNINTGAFSSNIVNAPTSNSITNVGNGWYRCAITTTTTSSSQFRIMMSNDGTSFTYVGSGQSIFIWGAQLEAGAYPTTYIPTTSAIATRVADSSRTTGRSSLIGQSEGTLFLDLYYLPLQNQGRAIAITETSNPLTNRLIININNTNNRVSVISRQSSSSTNGSMSESPATALLNGRNKIALGYKSGDSVLYINGVQVATNTDSFTFSATLNDIFLMTSEISLVADNVGFVYTSALFQTRLLNSQIATLTT